MKKIPRAIVIFPATLLAVYAILSCVLNFYVIPQKIIPRVRQYLASTSTGPVRARVDSIYFSPFSGFMLKGVAISSSLGGKEAPVLFAPEVDVDLSFFALLLKRVEVKRLALSAAAITLIRDEHGAWNFATILGSAPKDKKTPAGKGWVFSVNKVSIKRSRLEYEDIYERENSLRRSFADVEISIIQPRSNIYTFDFSLGNPDGAGESISGSLEYDTVASSFKGQAKFRIRYLSEYREYYLDDLLRPWDLVSDDISGKLAFDWKNDSTEFDADYKVAEGLLRHGDFSVRADYAVRQALRYKKGHFDKDNSRTEITFVNATFQAGDKAIISNARGNVTIAKRVMDINGLTGVLWGRPVFLNGEFSFKDSRQLGLSGRLGDFDAQLLLDIRGDNQAQLALSAKKESSFFKLHSRFIDLKQLKFSMLCEADMSGADLKELSGIERFPLVGRMTLSAFMSGDLDEPRSYQGSVRSGVTSLARAAIQPLSCDIDASIHDGVLDGRFPADGFYGGELYGIFKLDPKRCGLELDLGGLNIEELSAAYPRLKGLTGTLNGTLVVVCPWGHVTAAEGGGYLKMTDCDLRSSPMFHAAEEGLVAMIKNFIMPTFDEAEANFLIKERRIKIENAFCKASNINLGIKGSYGFDASTDFTVGVSLFGGGVAGTVKQVLRPLKLGVNLLANSFEVDIYGQWPGLQHRVNVRPTRWLEDFLRVNSKADPRKYSLEKSW